MAISNLEIKLFREEVGWTQKKLADELGITLRTVQNYEEGKTIPRPKQEYLRKFFEKVRKEKTRILNEESSPYSSFEKIIEDRLFSRFSEKIEKFEDRIDANTDSIVELLRWRPQIQEEVTKLKRLKGSAGAKGS